MKKNRNEIILEVIDSIEEAEVIELLKNLIKIESHKDTKGQELEVNNYIKKYLSESGIKSEIDYVIDNRPNLYAKIGKNKKGKNLMLTGHIDTVPPYNMENPFTPIINNNVIYGRGSVDMKGAMTAMIIALKVIHKSGIKLEGELLFASVIDEEQNCQGTKHMVDNVEINSDYAIVGEPTDLDVMIGHKGMEWLEITVHGVSTHGSSPEKGVNSIIQAAQLILDLNIYFESELSKRKHKFLGKPTMNIGVIKGGVDPNVVPDKTIIQIDRRWVPEESPETMKEDIELVIKKLKNKDPQFKAEVRRMDEATGYHPPLNTLEDEKIVKHLSESSKELFNKDIKIGSFTGWSDAAPLSLKGIQSVVCGPGNLDYAHSNNEQIKVEEVVKAAKYYAYTALKICM